MGCFFLKREGEFRYGDNQKLSQRQESCEQTKERNQTLADSREAPLFGCCEHSYKWAPLNSRSRKHKFSFIQRNIHRRPNIMAVDLRAM